MTLTVPAHDPAARDKPAGRIRQKNEEAILAAAEEEFARHGFKGTSMNTIAQNVGLPKANLHYYFGNKLGLYTAVLSNILELWDSTFNTLGVDDDPAEALARYIRAKMEFSRRYRWPRGSSPWRSSAAASASPRISTRTTAAGSAAALRYSRPGSPPAGWTRWIPCT